MPIRDVIAVVNRMQADGIINGYAIGGAVGATFYLEPVATVDVDIFVMFRDATGSGLARHRLTDLWQKFQRQFLTDST